MNSVKMTVNETDKKAHLESVITYEDPEGGLITIRFDGFLPALATPVTLDPDSADVTDLSIVISASNFPGDENPYVIDSGTGKWTLDK